MMPRIGVILPALGVDWLEPCRGVIGNSPKRSTRNAQTSLMSLGTTR